MNFEFSNQQSEMELVPRLPGRSLCRGPQKLSLQDVELDVNFDSVSQNNSQRELPKFPTLHRSEKLILKKPENALSPFRPILANRNADKPIRYVRRKPKSFLIGLVQFIIWICYFISTAQTKFQSIELMGVINIAGVAISVFYFLYKTFILHQQLEFSDILHGISLGTTLALYFYAPTTPSDRFKDFMVVIRSLRLFFPLNREFAFKNLMHKYFLISTKIVKSSLKLIAVIVFFSLIMQQSGYGSVYNRCRPTITTNYSQFYAVGSQLCGSQLCLQNYTCLNPQTYDLSPDMRQLYNNADLGYGFFSFSTLYTGTFSILSLGTLSQSAQIINIYSNSLDSYFLSAITILVIFSLQFASYLILMVVVTEISKQEHYQLTMQEHTQQGKKEIRLRLMSQKSLQEGYSNALTFGLISNRETSAFKKSSHSLKPNKEQGQSANLTLQVKKPSKPQKQVRTKQEAAVCQSMQKQEQPDQIQSCQILKIVLYGSIYLIQFVLNLLFSVHCLDQFANRIVGVTLCCMLILWTFKMMHQLYSKHFEEDDEQYTMSPQMKQNQQIMAKIQIPIYIVAFLDYICRVFQQGYLMQTTSPLTPLSTALLSFRVVYLFLALHEVSPMFSNFSKILKIVIITVQNLLGYIFVAIVLAAILSTCSGDLLNASTYFDKLSVCLSAITNNNWLQQIHNIGNISQKMNSSFDYIFGINFVLIIIGQIFLLKLIMSQAIVCSCCQLLRNNLEQAVLQIESEPTEEQILEIIQQQKSLYLFQFNGNFRNAIYSILKNHNYNNIKLMLIKAYCWISFFGYILDKQSATFSSILMGIDIFLLCDSLFSVVAIRFWGKCSFIDNQWYNLVNFIITVALVVNSFKWAFDLFFLRPFRLMLLLKHDHQFNNSYVMLRNMASALIKLLPFLAIVLLFNFVLCIDAALQNSSRDILKISLDSLVNAFLMLQKGFDLQKILQMQNNPYSLYNLQSSIYYTLIAISINACLIALMLRQLLQYQEQKEKVQIKQLMQVSDTSISLKTAQENYQQKQISEEILALKPATHPHFYLEQSYLLQLSQQPYFYNIKVTACVMNGLILLVLGCLGGVFSQPILFKLKILRLFFYIVQVLMFIVQCWACECNIQHFCSTTLIYIATLPGNFISLVPFHKIYGSDSLKSVLSIFVSLPPINYLTLYFTIKSKSSTKRLLQRCEKSCYFLVWFIYAGWFISAIYSVCLKQNFLLLMAYVMVGFFGGNYHSYLDLSELSPGNKAVVNVLHGLVVVCGWILSNGLIALLLWELNSRIKQRMEWLLYSHNKPTLISRNNIRRVFSTDKLVQVWNGLDLEGSGVLSYSVLLHNLPKFLKALTSANYYLQFLLHPKYDAYFMKLHMLRSLCLPVRTANKQNLNQRETSYVITIYDLAARVMCLALQQDYFRKNISSGQSSVMQAKHLIKFLQFDTSEWNEKVSRCISKLNSTRAEIYEEASKLSLQKKVDLDSSGLVSVLRVLGRLRRRVATLKAKLQ